MESPIGLTSPHPDAAIARFVASNASQEERRLVLRHIVGGCSQCGERVYRALAGPAPPAGDQRSSDREHLAAERTVEKLLALPAAHAWLFAVNSERAAWLAVSQLLANESRQLAYHHPRDGLRLAELGTALAERIVGPGGEEARALAWTSCTQLRRSSGDLPGAEVALDRAARSLAADTIELPTRAFYLCARAMVADWQGREEEALLHLIEGLRILRGHDQPRALAIVLLRLAHLCSKSGRAAIGLRATEAAFRISLRLSDSQMRRILAHNVAVVLSDAGDLEAARALHQQLRPLMDGADDMVRWRHDWLGARLASRNGGGAVRVPGSRRPPQAIRRRRSAARSGAGLPRPGAGLSAARTTV